MEKKRILKFLVVLSIFLIQILFLSTIFKERMQHNIVPYVVGIVLLLLVLVYRKTRLHHQEFSVEKFSLTFWIPISAIVTYLLNNDLGLGSVFALGIVGTVGSFITFLNPRSSYLKDIAAPIYCGAFIGMSPLRFEYVYLMIFTAGIFSAVLFALTKSLFVGIGGKLGTLAFIGFLMSILLFQLLFS